MQEYKGGLCSYFAQFKFVYNMSAENLKKSKTRRPHDTLVKCQ